MGRLKSSSLPASTKPFQRSMLSRSVAPSQPICSARPSMLSDSYAQPFALSSSNLSNSFSVAASSRPAVCVELATRKHRSPKLRWADMAFERAWNGMLSLAKRTPFSLMKMPLKNGRTPELPA